MFIDENGNEATIEEIVEQYKNKGMDVEVTVGDAEIYTNYGGIYKKEIRKNCTIIRMK